MEYSIGELARKAGVTRRTVRFYIEEGLLPPPERGGRAASYTSEHLDQLGRIKDLKELRFTLDEIRDELGQRREPARPFLDEPVSPMLAAAPDPETRRDDAGDYLARLRSRLGSPARSSRSPKPDGSSYGAEPWLRIPLSEDVELHVRRRGSRTDPRLARLIKEARRILEEEENES